MTTATKPTVDISWAIQDVANGANSTNNKVATTPSHKAFGITFPEPPGRNHFNYWMNGVDQWKLWFERAIDEGGLLTSNYGINTETSDYSSRVIVIGTGTVLGVKTDSSQTFLESSETSLTIATSTTTVIGVRTDTGAILATSNLYSQSYEVIPLYRVTTNASVITQVVDLRSLVRGLSDNGGFTKYDPQQLGAIQADSTDPRVHPSTPNWFLGKYSGSGASSKQGFTVGNGTNDYIEYSEGKLETGSDVDVTINKSLTLPPGATTKGIWTAGDTISSTRTRAAMLSRGFLRCDGEPVSRTTYADLFAEIGTQHGEGDGSTTFNLPFEPPTVQPTLSYPTDFAIHGTWPGSGSLDGIAINQKNGDIWVCGGQSDSVYKSTDGGLTYTAVGGFVDNPHGIAVNSLNGDVWITDNTDSVRVLRGGIGTFSLVAADTGNRFGTLAGIAVNNITNDVYFTDSGQAKVWILPGGFSSDTILLEVFDFGSSLLGSVAINQSTGDVYVASQTLMYIKKDGIETSENKFRQIGNAFPTIQSIAFDRYTGSRWAAESNGVYVAQSGVFSNQEVGNAPTWAQSIAINERTKEVWITVRNNFGQIPGVYKMVPTETSPGNQTYIAF